MKFIDTKKSADMNNGRAKDTIIDEVERFSSKNVADYNSMELVSWYMALTLYKMSAEGAVVRKSVIKALKKVTKELKHRDLM